MASGFCDVTLVDLQMQPLECMRSCCKGAATRRAVYPVFMCPYALGFHFSPSFSLVFIYATRRVDRAERAKIEAQNLLVLSSSSSALLHLCDESPRASKGSESCVCSVEARGGRVTNRLKGTADQYGLPTFIVADAGRTQVQAGSKTVLAIGPGMLPVSCLYM
ncbi:hypothetical protein M5K25_008057 [Dendrobium thyrsiflorum]|uniref:peptidyl-tRNA hydrolase n=1 Tax=Dendrobium thyrsiflorum TaxID=117978 RepID=A0ABD0V7R5_DENTH